MKRAAASDLFRRRSWYHYFSVNLYCTSSPAESCACPLRKLQSRSCATLDARLREQRVAAKDGIETISGWHDPLGYTVLAICLLLIWGFARLVSGPIPNVRAFKRRPQAGSFPLAIGIVAGAMDLVHVLRHRSLVPGARNPGRASVLTVGGVAPIVRRCLGSTNTKTCGFMRPPDGADRPSFCLFEQRDSLSYRCLYRRFHNGPSAVLVGFILRIQDRA